MENLNRAQKCSISRRQNIGLLCVWVGGVRGGGEVHRTAVSQRYFEFNHTHGYPQFADILYCPSVYSHE